MSEELTGEMGIEEPEEGGGDPGNEVITVTCGANTQCFGDVVGKTVAEIRGELRDALNIDPSSEARVGGDLVENTYHLRPGDTLEFIRPSGKKG